MWSALGAWLVGIITKDVMEWLKSQILSVIEQKKKEAADHAAAEKEADQDTEKLKQIKNETDAKKVDEAIDDSLQHL